MRKSSWKLLENQNWRPDLWSLERLWLAYVFWIANQTSLGSKPVRVGISVILAKNEVLAILGITQNLHTPKKIRNWLLNLHFQFPKRRFAEYKTLTGITNSIQFNRDGPGEADRLERGDRRSGGEEERGGRRERCRYALGAFFASIPSLLPFSVSCSCLSLSLRLSVISVSDFLFSFNSHKTKRRLAFVWSHFPSSNHHLFFFFSRSSLFVSIYRYMR